MKFIVTFGSRHLKDYDVVPLDTAVLIEGQTSYLALLDYFGPGFVGKFQGVAEYTEKDKMLREQTTLYKPEELEKRRIHGR